ncbi:hypothetical protein FK220_013170 [Flavobacteriaceae bacterium TP-CH-4]|uniref:DUF541 domain-containing protein n=1 Tax=Pelagihabitans pacificus TaxID=2696054 RepID=A0A967AWA8_9FLAO|nr:hypothetical protein [Pelagihabitans pacificus]NHF60298.1 hypothetical protein [Pelagihabitans pacificus]
MKKISLLFILLPMLVMSRQNKAIIKVSGHAVHIDPTPSFNAIVSLSGSYSNFPSEVVGLEEMKIRYREALKKAGISWDTLKESPNDFGYETLGYEKEGTIYEYRTTSVLEMKKFLTIKTFGLQHLRSFARFAIDAHEVKRLNELALANAKDKAVAIAAAMDK